MTRDEAIAELKRRGVDVDAELAKRRGQSPAQQPKTDWKGVVGQSVKNIFQKPIAYAKDIGTNPQSMANALPPLMGTAGGMSPIPGGATMGTAAGQGIRDLALMGLKKPIPSGLQHGIELGGAAVGDIAAIPSLKSAHYGGQIGEAERAAKVVTRAPTKAVTPGSVGETLNNLEAQIDSGAINTPQAAKDAKAVISQIYKNPKIYEQTGEISVQAQRVSSKVENLINSLIKGRQGPSAAMSKAMAVPRFLGKVQKGYMRLPWALRHGAEAAIGYESVKKLMDPNQR